MKTLLTLLAIAALSFGCSKKDDDKAGDGDKPAAADAATATAPPATADAAPVDEGEEVAEDVPTAEDFEEEAATEITDKNMEKELADLEKELEE
jgi:hypothetical protein